MKTKLALGSASGVLMLGLVLLLTPIVMGSGQRGRGEEGRAREYAPAFRLPPPSPVPAPGHLGFELEVDPDDPQAAIVEQIAAQLKAANPTPAARIERFRWLDNPKMRVDGWHGRIEELTVTPTGWVATIRVTPRVTSTFAAATFIGDQILERYESVNGRLQFLGAEEVPGRSLHGAFIGA